jgi:hypothetical protein
MGLIVSMSILFRVSAISFPSFIVLAIQGTLLIADTDVPSSSSFNVNFCWFHT